MLEIHADQVFTIGIVSGVPQPVVVEPRGCATCQLGSGGIGIHRYSAGTPGAPFSASTIPDVLVRGRFNRPVIGGKQGSATMLRYIVRRILMMIPTLLAISVARLRHHPAAAGRLPRDLHRRAARPRARRSTQEKIEFLRRLYGLDKPMWEQYFVWVFGMLQGDFGYSFEFNLPVNEVVGDRLWLSILLSFSTIIFTWVVAFPIGIYSATHQYSWGDYGLTFIGFLGLATPNFLLALVLLYLANVWFGISIGGLMDERVHRPADGAGPSSSRCSST